MSQAQAVTSTSLSKLPNELKGENKVVGEYHREK